MGRFPLGDFWEAEVEHVRAGAGAIIRFAHPYGYLVDASRSSAGGVRRRRARSHIDISDGSRCFLQQVMGMVRGNGAGGNGAEAKSAGRPIVVVVGGDHASCDSLGRILVEEGCATGFQSLLDPRQALDVARDADAEVILVSQALGRNRVLRLASEAGQAGIRVVVFGAEGGPGLILEMVEAGAVAVVHKAASLGETVETVRRAASGETSFPPGVVYRMARRMAELARLCRRLDRDPRRLYRLTDREEEVLELVAEGASNRAVADKLFVSVGTVKSHMHRVLRKLEVRSREDAAEFVKVQAAANEAPELEPAPDPGAPQRPGGPRRSGAGSWVRAPRPAAGIR